MNGIIYLIRNKSTGKSYIGQTTNYEKRMRGKFSQHTHNQHFQNAIRKYGEDQFTTHIIEICPEADLNAREIFWIATLDTYNNGYNLTTGGEGTRNRIVTKETREKMSKSQRKRPRSSWKAPVLTDEARQRISQASIGNTVWLGRKHTQESREKMSRNRRGNKLSPEQRENIAKSKRGKKHSPEHRQSISNSLKGRQFSEEHKANLSKRAKQRKSSNWKGRKHTAESKLKMSQSAKRRWSREQPTD